jgi:hypothetical protein
MTAPGFELHSASVISLVEAQHELATYGAKGGDQFLRLWSASTNALKLIWWLREDMATHSLAHKEVYHTAKAG